jgi:hypothetical protein
MADKTSAVLNNVPTTLAEQLEREQNIGMTRGLAFFESLVQSQINTLNQELNEENASENK